MIDLNTLDLQAQADAGFTLELLHPIDNTVLPGMTIRIRGDKSKTVEVYERKRIKEIQKREKVRKGKNQDTDFSIEELEEMAVEAAVVRVMGWSGFLKDEQIVEFTPENAAAVFTKYKWIRDQVREAAEDLDNFRPEGS